MFGKGALIKMANGEYKDISLIVVGDYILNKFNHSIKVNRIHIKSEQTVVEVILDNDALPFYVIPTTTFLYRNVNDIGDHDSGYAFISTIYKNECKLKSSMKVFSPQSDVTIEQYTEYIGTMDTYCLHVNETTYSFIANNCIVCCENC